MSVQTNASRQSAYDINPVFLNRWSPRSFSTQEVPEDILLSLFEASRWAPSAFNRQPWRFILAHTQEAREKFHSFIGEFNMLWCKPVPAFALIISEKVTEHGENRSASFDAGAAWGFLALEAVHKGLITHPMTGIDFAKAREVLNIPETYEIDALVAIGYQGTPEALPEQLREREQPSQRRATKESVFEGSFGRSLK
ncbi:nitroreductase family protein [Ectobacillus ponti]|uniref:Nitroreductase family protein n=1 Tax=Ectobacillus ponti TaxID=2961894 RepID=A0AA41XC90_9BACI|nr:nitroreductase family protein [Ectobacillus ponti]MCP8969406.1 nitroreductase family protein [Ectobacillus ponti]